LISNVIFFREKLKFATFYNLILDLLGSKVIYLSRYLDQETAKGPFESSYTIYSTTCLIIQIVEASPQLFQVFSSDSTRNQTQVLLTTMTDWYDNKCWLIDTRRTL